MRRLLWMTLGAVLALLVCAVGWIVSGGWHTNELVLINYLHDDRKVAVYDNKGSVILAPTNEARAKVRYDMPAGKGGPTIVVEGMPPQLGDYTFPCDGEVHYIVVRKDGSVDAFGVMEGGTLDDFRRATRCLIK